MFALLALPTFVSAQAATESVDEVVDDLVLTSLELVTEKKGLIHPGFWGLWTGCQSMYLLVEDLPQDATEIGLTQAAITTAVRSRLRSARVYDGDRYAGQLLYVNVNVVGRAHSVSVEFKRSAYLPPVPVPADVSDSVRVILADLRARLADHPAKRLTQLPDQLPVGSTRVRVTTWDTGGTGTHGDASYILSGISQHIDRFIDEYLEVNEEFCP